MFLPVSKIPARLLALIGLASVGAVVAALIAQHGFGVKPCPWCVMQRAIFLLLGIVAGLGWLLKRTRPIRQGAFGLLLLLALAGLASAYYQHDVASKLASCDMTLADRVVTALDLETLWPDVFMITASCAEAAAYRLLGQPYELWSALLFGLILLAAMMGLRRR
jgi:protein dithiol:quinone oxidoreductase